MLFLWTVSLENLTGYDDIVCELAVCTFNLQLYIFVYLMLVMKTNIYECSKNVSLYSVHSSFPTFNV